MKPHDGRSHCSGVCLCARHGPRPRFLWRYLAAHQIAVAAQVTPLHDISHSSSSTSSPHLLCTNHSHHNLSRRLQSHPLPAFPLPESGIFPPLLGIPSGSRTAPTLTTANVLILSTQTQHLHPQSPSIPLLRPRAGSVLLLFPPFPSSTSHASSIPPKTHPRLLSHTHLP